MTVPEAQPAIAPEVGDTIRMRKQSGPLSGTGLLQSEEEWASRGRALTTSLLELAKERVAPDAQRGVDIGCQQGSLTDLMREGTGFDWSGIDPVLTGRSRTPGGAEIGPGRADAIPYPDEYFDCGMFANVFEHVPPAARQDSLDEMWRVLRPGGVIVGQIPNPYFIIESHSRLPFMGWLPVSVQRKYWKLSPVPWDHDFFVVTMRHLRRHAEAAGFVIELARPFNYPLDAIPAKVRLIARMLSPVMRIYPWAWQFVLRRPAHASPGDSSDSDPTSRSPGWQKRDSARGRSDPTT